MDCLKIIAVSLASLVVLFVLTKLMGNRQVSQLTMFDYVIGISIGSIAAEMATELDKPMHSVIAMAVYAAVACLISLLTAKFLPFRRTVFGKSTVLMKNGEFLRENFKKAKLDLGEFLMQCRTAGYFSVSDIDTAVLEPNGTVSFLPFAPKRPATPEDLKLVPGENVLPYNVIADGVILDRNLKALGLDRKALFAFLKEQGETNAEQIFLVTADKNGSFTLYKSINNTPADPFE